MPVLNNNNNFFGTSLSPLNSCTGINPVASAVCRMPVVSVMNNSNNVFASHSVATVVPVPNSTNTTFATNITFAGCLSSGNPSASTGVPVTLNVEDALERKFFSTNTHETKCML
jgi:hypothetical protein